MIRQLEQSWEYDEIAALKWLPQSVLNDFSRFSERTQNAIAFKYMREHVIEGVGIGKVSGERLIIGHLQVRSDARGRGIGTALLNYFLDIAEQNHMNCHLQVSFLNYKAQRLYRSFDFSPIPHNKSASAFWMAREPLAA